MPKCKTKSSCKKRFKITASGLIKHKPAGKRHGMVKRSNKFVRSARPMAVMFEGDAAFIRKFFPYGA